MKRMNKVISMVLVGTMIFSLAACGNQKETASTTESAATQAETEKEQESTTDEEEATVTESDNEEYFPLADGIEVTMAGLRRDEYTQYSDCEVFKKAEEETNIKVNWLDWALSVSSEKKGLAFASGDLPDALFGGWILTNSEIMEYGPDGFLLDFKPYLESGEMPNLAKIIEKRPELLEAITAPDGKIYALPSYSEANPVYATNDTVLINTTWLDKVGKEMPTTTEELYDVLKAFKEAGDLNGNGKEDEIPLSFRYGDNNNGHRSMFGWFGMALNTENNPIALDDGTVVWPQAEPEYREACEFFSRLYNEGLMDPEVFTMDSSAYSAKTSAETPILGVMSTWSYSTPNNNATNGDVYAYLPPLKSDNGKEPKIQARPVAYNQNFSFAINAKSEYADQLVHWADRWYDVGRSIDVFYGGPNYYEKVSDGVYREILDEDGKVISNEIKTNYSPVNFALYCILSEDFALEELSDSTKIKLEANDVYGAYVPRNTYPTSAFYTLEESQTIADITTDLYSYMDQSIADFITNGVTDDSWNAYVTQLDSLGLPQLLEIWQNVYDRN